MTMTFFEAVRVCQRMPLGRQEFATRCIAAISEPLDARETDQWSEIAAERLRSKLRKLRSAKQFTLRRRRPDRIIVIRIL